MAPVTWREAKDLPDPDDVIRAPGPWTHRDISANATRFHVVEAGKGPLVLLLHGFPTFWWTWRHLLTDLPAAGFRAVAVDIRGYGGSDHTPHGYDPTTLARDVAGIIRCLGEADAVIVGHGWGGLMAWSTAVLQPQVVRSIVPISMAHPLALRSALLRDRAQASAQRYTWGFQIPFAPERSLERQGAVRVAELLRSWSAPGSQWPDDDTAAVFRAAMLVPNTAHCAVEYHRWALRSIPRRDGRTYADRMEAPVTVPVLALHGRDDPAVLLRTVESSEEFVRSPYALRVLDGVGHFPHEEAPDDVSELLVSWLRADPPWDDDGVNATVWSHDETADSEPAT